MSRHSFRNTTNRLDTTGGDDWRHHSACRDEDAELFWPVGTTGPALRQAERAKAVCRRCPLWVQQECLNFAVEQRIDDGIFAGMDAKERSHAYANRAAA
ncbi:WhiB family transcriptional regulator [Micromonospora wenchangensis]|uniref:WhiB family transcriptional regulator n=1 Tax=Micromonospora wenchangensis TaxID=1185415 RepID=UPI0038295162